MYFVFVPVIILNGLHNLISNLLGIVLCIYSTSDLASYFICILSRLFLLFFQRFGRLVQQLVTSLLIRCVMSLLFHKTTRVVSDA